MACELDLHVQWLVDLLSEVTEIEDNVHVRKILKEYHRWLTTERPTMSMITNGRSIDRKTLVIIMEKYSRTDNEVYYRLKN